MEARSILGKIRQHGVTIKAIGNTILLAPKKLINDRIVGFVRDHKEKLLTALYQEEDERKALHRERKRALNQGRLEVFRCLMRRHLKPSDLSRMVPTDYEIEEYIDGALKQNDYDIEDAILTYRNIIPTPTLVCKCGYRPPFCSCGGIPVSGMVTCSQCENFTPDKVGDGTGIGLCSLGLQYTEELHGHKPLYRYADRRCDKFKQKTLT